MFSVFNMGIGMVVVVAPFFAEAVVRRLRRERVDACVIGEIKRGRRGVQLI